MMGLGALLWTPATPMLVTCPTCSPHPHRMPESVRMLAKTKPRPADSVGTAEVTATKQLLDEISKPERSLDTISRLVQTLENVPLIEKASKLKRALAADWKLEYASDADAVQPFLTGPESPFAVVEGIVHRWKSNGEFQTIEVRRKLGPFGNSKQMLCGKFSVNGDSIRWRATYILDARSREVPVPSGWGTANMRVSYISPLLLLLRPSADSSRLLLFARVENLKSALEELRVSDEDA